MLRTSVELRTQIASVEPDCAPLAALPGRVYSLYPISLLAICRLHIARGRDRIGHSFLPSIIHSLFTMENKRLKSSSGAPISRGGSDQSRHAANFQPGEDRYVSDRFPETPIAIARCASR